MSTPSRRRAATNSTPNNRRSAVLAASTLPAPPEEVPVLNFRFGIVVVHQPYVGAPTPFIPQEWVAYTAERLPELRHNVWLGDTLSIAQVDRCAGRTREEAIEGLKACLRERLVALHKGGILVEQDEVEVSIP